MPQLSVVMLAYNELDSIDSAVRELMATLQVLPSASELLIVDDGSTDGTGKRADTLATEFANVRVIHHESNLGLGGGYRTGFAEARGDFITFFPADGQFPATIIPMFLKAAVSADMVLGYIPERPGSWVPKLLSLGERLLYTCLFGRMPVFQGILMFRRALLAVIELHSTGRGWAVLLELVIKVSRRGFKIVCLPTACRPRVSGISKVNNLRTIRANLYQVILLRRRL